MIIAILGVMLASVDPLSATRDYTTDYSLVAKTYGYDDFTKTRITSMAKAAKIEPIFGSLEGQHIGRLGNYGLLCKREKSGQLISLIFDDLDLRSSIFFTEFESRTDPDRPYLSFFTTTTLKELTSYSVLKPEHRTKRDQELIDRLVKNLKDRDKGDEPLRFRRRHDTKLGPCYEAMYEVRGAQFLDGWNRVQVWGRETSLSYAMKLLSAPL